MYGIIKREREVISVRQDAIGTLVLYAPSGNVDLSAPVYPKERKDEILSCRSESVKREKLAVWKLLEKATREHLKLDFANLKFTKTQSGKWICPEFCFSLSHSGDMVAVAVSLRPVGVDVQKYRTVREGLERRILTESELGELEECPPSLREDLILSLWTSKESLFKRDGGECLSPRQRETQGEHVSLKRFEYGKDKYVLAVATEDGEENIEIRFTEDI